MVLTLTRGHGHLIGFFVIGEKYPLGVNGVSLVCTQSANHKDALIILRMFALMFKLPVTLKLLVSIISTNGQIGNCPSIIQNTMTEYRQCIDYSYLTLFSMKYDQITDTSVARQCNANNFAKCRTDADRNLGRCLDFSQREALETNFQMIEAGYRYWCSEYAVKLREFYNAHAADCYFSQQSIFRTCEREYPLINIHLQSYDRNYCGNLNSVINCLQQVYEKCLVYEDPALIRGYYEIMWKTTPCFIVDQQYLFNCNAILKINFNLILICVIFIKFVSNFPSQN